MRTYTSSTRPTAVSVTVPTGSIYVEVIKRPADADDPGAATVSLVPQVTHDAVAEGATADATIREELGELTVVVPPPTSSSHGSGVVTNVYTGDGQIFQSTGGGITIINGRIVAGGTAVVTPSGAVDAVLTVPTGTRLRLDGRNTCITVAGPAGRVEATTVNGNIHIDKGGTVTADNSNGSITIGAAEHVEATTSNGSIYVLRVTGDTTLRTTNGSICAGTTTTDFEATTVNGNIEVVADGVRLPASAVRTVNGRTSIR